MLDRSVQPVGFERDEGMLPYAARSFPGYRLLDRVLRVPAEVPVLRPGRAWAASAGKAGRTLEVYFYLDRSTVDLEQNVTADTFQLGCTPIVNLYPQRAEPIG